MNEETTQQNEGSGWAGIDFNKPVEWSNSSTIPDQKAVDREHLREARANYKKAVAAQNRQQKADQKEYRKQQRTSQKEARKQYHANKIPNKTEWYLRNTPNTDMNKSNRGNELRGRTSGNAAEIDDTIKASQDAIAGVKADSNIPENTQTTGKQFDVDKLRRVPSMDHDGWDASSRGSSASALTGGNSGGGGENSGGDVVAILTKISRDVATITTIMRQGYDSSKGVRESSPGTTVDHGSSGSGSGGGGGGFGGSGGSGAASDKNKKPEQKKEKADSSKDADISGKDEPNEAPEIVEENTGDPLTSSMGSATSQEIGTPGSKVGKFEIEGESYVPTSKKDKARLENIKKAGVDAKLLGKDITSEEVESQVMGGKGQFGKLAQAMFDAGQASDDPDQITGEVKRQVNPRTGEIFYSSDKVAAWSMATEENHRLKNLDEKGWNKEWAEAKKTNKTFGAIDIDTFKASKLGTLDSTIQTLGGEDDVSMRLSAEHAKEATAAVAALSPEQQKGFEKAMEKRQKAAGQKIDIYAGQETAKSPIAKTPKAVAAVFLAQAKKAQASGLEATSDADKQKFATQQLIAEQHFNDVLSASGVSLEEVTTLQTLQKNVQKTPKDSKARKAAQKQLDAFTKKHGAKTAAMVEFGDVINAADSGELTRSGVGRFIGMSHSRVIQGDPAKDASTAVYQKGGSVDAVMSQLDTNAKTKQSTGKYASSNKAQKDMYEKADKTNMDLIKENAVGVAKGLAAGDAKYDAVAADIYDLTDNDKKWSEMTAVERLTKSQKATQRSQRKADLSYAAKDNLGFRKNMSETVIRSRLGTELLAETMADPKSRKEAIAFAAKVSPKDLNRTVEGKAANAILNVQRMGGTSANTAEAQKLRDISQRKELAILDEKNTTGEDDFLDYYDPNAKRLKAGMSYSSETDEELDKLTREENAILDNAPKTVGDAALEFNTGMRESSVGAARTQAQANVTSRKNMQMSADEVDKVLSGGITGGKAGGTVKEELTQPVKKTAWEWLTGQEAGTQAKKKAAKEQLKAMETNETKKRATSRSKHAAPTTASATIQPPASMAPTAVAGITPESSLGPATADTATGTGSAVAAAPTAPKSDITYTVPATAMAAKDSGPSEVSGKLDVVIKTSGGDIGGMGVLAANSISSNTQGA